MKIDSKFFEQRWVKAISAEFGAQGVLAVIRLFTEIYDSPQGYWADMTPMDRAVLAGEVGMDVASINALLDRLVEYRVIDPQKLRKDQVVTSESIQREYVKQVGVARARKLTWKEHCLLTTAQLLELGIYPAIYNRDFPEPYGEPLPVCPGSLTLHPQWRLIRLRHPDPLTHLYRVTKPNSYFLMNQAGKERRKAPAE